MLKLQTTGRIFYGIAIAATGFQTIYYKDFPYYLIPPKHSGIPGLAMLAITFGALLILAGACIVFEIKARQVSLLTGTILLSIFCFYHIPYRFMATTTYMQFGAWENAEKELALACGALIIAGCYSGNNEHSIFRWLGRMIPLGTIFFSLMMIIFGIDHYLYAQDVSEYIPAWIPFPVFWTYFAGTALIGSGIGIILNIKRSLNATLLGSMIFIWFIILHIPKAIASPFEGMGGEVTSAFLALAYSGTAFVIAGRGKV